MSRTHRIYINRAHVFDDGITWTTVAGLYPHAYVPEEEYAAAIARAELAEAALAVAEESLQWVKENPHAHREVVFSALAKIAALKGGAA